VFLFHSFTSSLVVPEALDKIEWFSCCGVV